jgi:serine/threonine-protein kinase
MELADRLREAVADRYAVERELGRGGMAVVYLARDLRHGRRVAIKVLRPELTISLATDRFLREIQIAAQLQHPLIVPLHDSGVSNELLWYVMPFVEGENLRQRLQRERQLPLAEALSIARDAAAALQCAHQHGFVHRDIKPENILLSSGHAMLTDFGIARALTQAAGEGTSSGVAIGTPAYMSPEQASGGAAIDARSDVYSLGCVLYEMLVGEPPFTGPTPQAVIARHVSERPPSVVVVRPSVPAPLEQVLATMLAKAPADRFRSADELAQALESLGSQGPSVEPRSPSPGRSPIWYVALAVVAVAVAVTALVRGAGVRGDDGAQGPWIVVLPFENLGAPSDSSFALGITDEISSRLAGIAALSVVSRTSAAHYSARDPIREIGRSLKVDYVLTGSIRTDRSAGASSLVRVTPQLVRAADNRTIWSDGFDAPIVPGEIVKVQSLIAQRVADALNLRLQPAEELDLQRRPTDNLLAYDAYLRGNLYSSQFLVGEGARQALAMYEEAVRLDSNFALAHAKLGQVRSMYYYFFDRREDQLARARASVERAFALAPDLPAARIALGSLYYWGALDYDRALAQFNAVRERQPNNSELLWLIGSVQRRKGDYQQALSNFERAVRLDPRSQVFAFEVAGTLQGLRRYEEAEGRYDEASALAPDWVPPYASKATLYLAWQGDVERAREALRDAARHADVRGQIVPVLMTEVAYRPLLSLLEGPFERALAEFSLASGGVDSGAYYRVKAEYWATRDRDALARAYADSARTIWESRVQSQPDNFAPRIELAFALSTLGLTGEARREADAARALTPVAKDALRGTFWADQLARVYARLGEADRAIALLELLLAVPSPVGRAGLRADPGFARLRSDPRFQRLLMRE